MNKLEFWVAENPKKAAIAIVALAVGWSLAGISFFISIAT